MIHVADKVTPIFGKKNCCLFTIYKMLIKHKKQQISNEYICHM